MTNSPAASRSERQQAFFPPSADDVFTDFAPWLRSLVAEIDPRFVIGIARSAIRAIQLAGPACLPEPRLLLSHTALPFLTDDELRSARVLVFDDSIIFGSTMASVRDYLLSRGALVFCAAYVADRTNFFGENEQERRVPTRESPHSTLPVQVRSRLWPAAIRRHHAALARLIVTSPMHYNLDFPTFSLGGASFQREDLPLLMNVLKSISIVRKVTDVSSPAGADAGVFRYTAFLHDNCGLAAVAGARIRSVPKVRVSVQPSCAEIRVTPIVQVALPSRASVDSIQFRDDRLDTAWRRFTLSTSPSDLLYHQALFRLVTATIGVEFGLRFGRELAAAYQDARFDFQLGLLPQDLAVVLTPRNSAVLEDLVATESLTRCDVSAELGNGATQAQRELVPVVPDPPLSHDPAALAQEVSDRVAQQPALRIVEADPAWEAAGKVFLALRAVTDSPERRHAIPDNRRIERGLSYDTLYAIVAKNDNPNLDHDEFGAALDLLVDRGLVVPKVVKQGDEWLRAFYCGEDEEDQETLQFKTAFRDAYADYLSGSSRKPFSSFDLQKLSVVLKSQLSWLPLTLLPYKFGYVSAQFGTVPRIDWLTEGESSPCQEQITEKGKVLVPRNPYHRAIDLAWAPKDVRDFLDAFDYVASAFTALSDEAKLLMSTCRTHRHTFNAIAFELHAWCGHERSAPAFRYVPLLGIDLCGERRPATLETLLRTHYWNIRFITEAEKKHHAFFGRFEPLRAKLEQQFREQGAPAMRWWKMVMSRGLLEPQQDEEIRHCMELLLPLLAQAKLLTQYCHRLMLDNGLMSLEQLELAFAANGPSRSFREFDWIDKLSWASAADAYNKSVARGQLPGKSIFSQRLVREPPSIDNDTAFTVRAFDSAIACFKELDQAVTMFCPRYNTTDSEFPYAPETPERLLRDGSVERRRDNTFLLTLDIIGGTNSPQTPQMKERIRQILRALRSHELVFQDTGDDAYVACADDPRVLWDAAVAIRMAGASLIIPDGERFAGTRKGLYFGSVAVVTKPNAEVLLRDITVPNVLPQAFSLLAGIDKHIPMAQRNDFLIVEQRTLAKCEKRLGVEGQPFRAVTVRGKHFLGKGALLPLL